MFVPSSETSFRIAPQGHPYVLVGEPVGLELVKGDDRDEESSLVSEVFVNGERQSKESLQFGERGVYAVKAVVTDSSGNERESSFQFEVRELPYADSAAEVLRFNCHESEGDISLEVDLFLSGISKAPVDSAGAPLEGTYTDTLKISLISDNGTPLHREDLSPTKIFQREVALLSKTLEGTEVHLRTTLPSDWFSSGKAECPVGLLLSGLGETREGTARILSLVSLDSSEEHIVPPSQQAAGNPAVVTEWAWCGWGVFDRRVESLSLPKKQHDCMWVVDVFLSPRAHRRDQGCRYRRNGSTNWATAGWAIYQHTDSRLFVNGLLDISRTRVNMALERPEPPSDWRVPETQRRLWPYFPSGSKVDSSVDCQRDYRGHDTIFRWERRNILQTYDARRMCEIEAAELEIDPETRRLRRLNLATMIKMQVVGEGCKCTCNFEHRHRLVDRLEASVMGPGYAAIGIYHPIATGTSGCGQGVRGLVQPVYPTPFSSPQCDTAYASVQAHLDFTEEKVGSWSFKIGGKVGGDVGPAEVGGDFGFQLTRDIGDVTSIDGNGQAADTLAVILNADYPPEGSDIQKPSCEDFVVVSALVDSWLYGETGGKLPDAFSEVFAYTEEFALDMTGIVTNPDLPGEENGIECRGMSPNAAIRNARAIQ